MRIKQRDVYTTRYFRHGNSCAVVIPPDIRERMQLVPGDVLALNFELGVLWAVKVTRNMVIDRKKVAAIFDKLFTDNGESDGSE